MSKNNLFNQPGIEQIIPGRELPVAVKVTGRNIHAVSLIASVAGETNNVRTAVSAFFESDGSLSHVRLTEPGADHDVKAGEYLVLSEDKSTILIADQASYDFGKVFLPLAVAVDEAASSIVDSLLGSVK